MQPSFVPRDVVARRRSLRALRVCRRPLIARYRRTRFLISEGELQKLLVAADQVENAAGVDAGALQLPPDVAHAAVDAAIGHLLVERERAGDLADAHPSLASELEEEPLVVRETRDERRHQRGDTFRLA